MTSLVPTTLEAMETAIVHVTLFPYHAFNYAKEHFTDRTGARNRTRKRDLQPPKLHKRKRSLTPPLKGPTFKDMATRKATPRFNAQSQSPLFEKLPVEIRTMIWEEIVLEGTEADGEVKVEFFPSRALGRPRAWQAPWQPRVQQPSNLRSIIAVLQSCRAIYAEAIDLLYSMPTFVFSEWDVLLSWICNLLPQRLDKVRSIALRLTVTGKDIGMDMMMSYFWSHDIIARNDILNRTLGHIQRGASVDVTVIKDIVKVLADMSGLRSVKIEMEKDPCGYDNEEVKEGVLRVLRDFDKMRRAKKRRMEAVRFVVVVSWWKVGREERWGDDCVMLGCEWAGESVN